MPADHLPRGEPKSDHAFSLDTQATAETVRGILADLRVYLAARGLEQDFCGTVEIVMAETLNNIVEHAYAPDGIGPVLLRAALKAGRLVVELRDTGKAMPGITLPDKCLPDATCSADGIPEGGFGWFLIYELTAASRYRRIGDQNHLRLEFALNPR